MVWISFYIVEAERSASSKIHTFIGKFCFSLAILWGNVRDILNKLSMLHYRNPFTEFGSERNVTNFSSFFAFSNLFASPNVVSKLITVSSTLPNIFLTLENGLLTLQSPFKRWYLIGPWNEISPPNMMSNEEI